MLLLKDVVEMMELQNEQLQAYLHLASEELLMVSEEALMLADSDSVDLDDYADWEQTDIAIAQQILKTHDYLRLPDRFEMDEFDIMQRFCSSLEAQQGDELLGVLGGRGSFRRFKQKLHQLDLADQWYQFKGKALEQVAVEWLDQHNLSYDSEQTAKTDL